MTENTLQFDRQHKNSKCFDEAVRQLSLSQQLGNHYCRVLGAGIAERTQESRLFKSRVEKFVKEGAAFLCSCNSCKPVAFTGLIASGQRCGQDQFGDIGASLGTEHAHKLRKNFLSFWIQVEDPIHQGNVNAFVCQGRYSASPC